MSGSTVRTLIMKKEVVAAIVLLLVPASFAIAPSIVSRGVDPYLFSSSEFQPPSLQHLFGTDSLGRDMFSRIVYGTQVSLSIAIASTAIALIIGMLLGSVAGYKAGNADRAVTIVMDSLYSFPGFLLAMIVVVELGETPLNMALAVSIPWIAVFYRTSRSITKGVSKENFIEAEKGFGASDRHVVFGHVIPRTSAAMLVLASLALSRAILLVAGLGFLGFGIPPPTPEWGTLLNQARPDILTPYWWLTLFPGFMITYTALSLNMLGEGLSRALSEQHE